MGRRRLGLCRVLRQNLAVAGLYASQHQYGQERMPKTSSFNRIEGSGVFHIAPFLKSLKRHHRPESYTSGTVARPVVTATGNPAQEGAIVPTAATDNPVRACQA